MSLTPALDENAKRKRKEAVELCGKNRGPHDYIPIQWTTIESTKRVTRLMCRVCFAHVSISTLLQQSDEVTY